MNIPFFDTHVQIILARTIIRKEQVSQWNLPKSRHTDIKDGNIPSPILQKPHLPTHPPNQPQHLLPRHPYERKKNKMATSTVQTPTPLLPTSQPSPRQTRSLTNRLKHTFTTPPLYLSLLILLLIPCIYQLVKQHWSLALAFMLALQTVATWLQHLNSYLKEIKGLKNDRFSG
ncbi:unnamed protein product [Periconia digitata]|uniref:Uncharacterized protein n=1 Tax=Periconia digitata TaxID=1303443 RepID=A0A9W4URM8_9PLEO|nr:unnamed protein product [Periconia digitata]